MNITLERPSSSRPSSSRLSQPSSSRLSQPASSQASPSVQSRLTEATFANFLDGFQLVTPEDLLDAKGGRVRYVIEGQGGTQYRLGGWLTRVDPQLRYIRLVNPYARKSWSVQLRPQGKRVRLYYMPPGTSDEVAMMRTLLTQVENGTIQITKVP